MIRSYVATAKIVTPSAVTARLAGRSYDNGAIFVECKEAGFEGTNLIYCRYGLSVPYIKVKVDQKIWIEPTIHHDERWKYTGFVDCGGYEPADSDILFMGDSSGFKYIKLSSSEMKLAHAVPKFYTGSKTVNGAMHNHHGPTGDVAPPTDGT